MLQKATKLSEFQQAFEASALSGEAELDAFYCDDTMSSRQTDVNQSPIDKIFQSCMSLGNQNAHILMGHQGCGKSTELNVLKQRLERAGRSVSVINYRLDLDILDVSYEDLLIMVAIRLIEIADGAGCNLPEKLVEDIQNFWDDVETKTIVSNERNGRVGGGVSFTMPIFAPLVKLFANLSAEMKFGRETKTTIRKRLNRSTSQWIEYLEEVANNIAVHEGGEPILIFEDLDKLNSEMASDIFLSPLSRVPFPIILTFPIALSYSTRFPEIESIYDAHLLPMIKIKNDDGKAYDDGVEAIKRIVGKRADLNLFDDSALTLLIEKTGGVLRDLFKCISNAAGMANFKGSEKIEIKYAEAATIELRSARTRLIETKDYPFLINIGNGGKYRREIEDRDRLLKMLQGLIVLEYNCVRWHDLHPVIRDFLKAQGEL
jgi:energy-coupling factor transporter ATP-binding protein EcfA2